MLRIGHRGASGYHPENTLSSFAEALKIGAQGIELDVHVCGSGELVVIHDETLNRTTNGKGRVDAWAWDNLKLLTINEIEHIPLLEDVIELVGPEAHIFFEIKAADAAIATAAMVQRYLHQDYDPRRLWIISFNHPVLQEVLAAHPLIQIGASMEKWQPDTVSAAKRWGARAILPKYTLLNEARVKEAHQAGLQVFTWTVNAPEDMARLRAMEVDGIMSDYPDRLATIA